MARFKWLRYVWAGAITLALIAIFTLHPATAQLPSAHPLDPLTADEIQTAVAAIKSAHVLSEEARFPNMDLVRGDLVTMSNPNSGS